MNPNLSIISVVLNDSIGLHKTIRSIRQQDYDNFEIIVIDGGSENETINIIKSNESVISYWISEEDKGIYDAMNKGVMHAKGDWVLFLNAGDVFCNDKILNDIFLNRDLDNYDVLFGDHVVHFKDFRGRRETKAGKVINLKFGSQFCHQSTLVKKNLLVDNAFNFHNRISADFEFLFKMYLLKKRFEYLGLTISEIESGGLSDINQVEAIRSWRNVVMKSRNTSSLFLKLHYNSLIVSTRIRQLIKKLVNAIIPTT